MKTSLLSLLLAISLFCSAHEGGKLRAERYACKHEIWRKGRIAYGTLRHDAR